MKRVALIGLGVALVAFSAVGCCEKEKQDIQILTRQRDDALGKVTELQTANSAFKEREAGLMTQLTQKDAEVSGLKLELEQAKKRTGPVTGTGKTPTGGEVVTHVATLEGDVMFAPGRATITEAGKAELNKVLRDVKSKSGTIRIYGHTDSDPIVKTKNLWKDNLDLSANRAMEVTRFLIASGIDPKRIETIAMGEYHPLDAGKSAEAKKKNRRVDITVVSKG
jgi:chemotaxis protein MotB